MATVGTAIGLGATFAPVPWIAPAVAAVAGIAKLCQNVQTNRRLIKQLGSRCEALLTALRESCNGKSEESMKPAIDTSVYLLNDIKNRMIAWKARSKFSQFLQQDDIIEDIRKCNLEIDNFYDAFTIQSHMELHNWQMQFEENSKKDHEEVMESLTRIEDVVTVQSEVQNRSSADIAQMMFMMQSFMSKFEMGDRRHTDLASNLYAVQAASKQLLPNYDLKAAEVRRVGSHPVGGSPAFDIWEGEYLGREKCAVKVIRGIEVSPNTQKRFLREIKIWRDVWEQDKGNYILPFYGACHTDGPYPYMVSPWMKNGDALSYVKKYPDSVNRKFIIRHIAEGLRLLHTQNPPIAHGDIKAANILIDDHGRPLLADFGLSKFMEDMTGMPFTQSRGVSDSYRWFAPELCSAPGVLSVYSDVFSYAMTVLEVMTGEHPFSHIRRTPEVLIRMQQGERPRRPVGDVYVQRGLDDKLWNLLTRCWVSEPEQRPNIHQVLEELPPA